MVGRKKIHDFSKGTMLCIHCNTELNPDEVYYKSNGYMIPVCRECGRIHSYKTKWKKKSNDEIITEMKRMNSRMKILRKIIIDSFK